MNFLTLSKYTHNDFKEIFKRIENKDFCSLKNKTYAMMFFENSTRTHYSFIKAAQDLGANIIDFNAVGSALSKGESFYDTIKIFESFNVDGVVIRNSQVRYWEKLKSIDLPIINAGDGSGSHPSQALLDLYTIYENHKRIDNLKVLIIGDIKHSRVASSHIKLLRKIGSHVDLSGPNEFKINDPNWIDEFDSKIHEYDVIMLLRIQYERLNIEYEKKDYNLNYGLNAERLKKLNDNCIILHPGPFNMHVEVTKDVLKDKRCKIWKQVENGVEVRKMIFTLVNEGEK